jgi:hypothetical protein
MKTLLTFTFLLTPFLLVHAESPASQVASRYCPDPAKDFFKGSIYHTKDGKPWIEVAVDPDFEAKMVKERNLTAPLPLTPVYDLVVRIKPEFNYYCIQGWVEKSEIVVNDLPFSLPIEGKLVVGKNNEVIVEGINFFRTNKKDEHDRFIYEWKVRGWPDGIAPNKKLSLLLTAIQASLPVDIILISTAQTSSNKKQERSSVSFSLCAPTWGGDNAQYNIIGASDFEAFGDISSFLRRFEHDRVDGFAQIEPYSSHQSYFKYWVDLHSWRNNFATKLLSQLLEKGDWHFSQELLQEILPLLNERLSCGLVGRFIYYLPELNSQLLGVTYKGANGVFVGTKENKPTTAVHEFSHAFASLDDEYTYLYLDPPKIRKDKASGFLEKDILAQFDLGRNCSSNPSGAFSHNGKKYGANYEGCSYDSILFDGVDIPIFRSSKTSIMNIGNSNKFNVVSCGYIMSAIKGGDAKSYFPECAKMDGVIKDGVQASAFYPFFAALGRVFSPTIPAQKAAVGDSNSRRGNPYIIVENFDPNNRWGRIIEIVSDDMPSVSPVPAPVSPTPTPPSLSHLDSISNENIFDSLSIDLKVNGSDGPVEVLKGGRIVVSWLSEGAARCRAAWSKKDIALSGTITGKVSKSVIIRAACVDADGNRTDDVVEVQVY